MNPTETETQAAHTLEHELNAMARSPAPDLMAVPIRALIQREPITIEPTASIRAAAELMRDRRISSVLLVENGTLFGLITDRDLRNRVVAQGLDSQRPVADIATRTPFTLDASSPAFEAVLLMARHNIHHVPILDGAHIAGMITATDLVQQHSTSAVYLVGDIYKQTTLDELVQTSARTKLMQQQLAAAGASAYSTGHIVTAITDALTQQLIHQAQAQLGPAPVDYVWVAAGSQARCEQTAKSDQDNCLILDDTFDDAAHGTYFKAFSKWVCDGLAACGYIHCPGDMMAMNDTWRQPRKVWANYFFDWVRQPKPMALMLTCVFFDLRAIHGKTELLESLRQDVARHTKGNTLFLAHMVGNALKHRPPLGFFGGISLIKDGEGTHAIDLKHSGIVPIVDLARVYALAAGLTLANTHDRLEASADCGEISAQSARDLRDALEYLSKLRIAHQARQLAQNKRPDNFLQLDELSNFDRQHLKNAFVVVQTLQEVLENRYAGGQF
jgi:CBS domain-containing protein